jgi:hypothetical protein
MSRKHSTAFGISAAMAGAAAAAFLSMGTAHADIDFDGWQDLYGAPGTEGLADGQAAADVTYDQELFLSNPGLAGSFDTAVDSFQSTGTEHGLQQLIYALDPSAFVVQHDPDITGYLTIGSDAGGYLVPDDFLGYLATDLDFFALNPLGLDPLLLGPIIDTLLGFPAAV